MSPNFSCFCRVLLFPFIGAYENWLVSVFRKHKQQAGRFRLNKVSEISQEHAYQVWELWAERHFEEA